jgi:hypothetical protein
MWKSIKETPPEQMLEVRDEFGNEAYDSQTKKAPNTRCFSRGEELVLNKFGLYLKIV